MFDRWVLYNSRFETYAYAKYGLNDPTLVGISYESADLELSYEEVISMASTPDLWVPYLSTISLQNRVKDTRLRMVPVVDSVPLSEHAISVNEFLDEFSAFA